MDFSGGFFSFIQLILSRYADEKDPINIVKILLGVFAMSFDILFMVQHFILYRK